MNRNDENEDLKGARNIVIDKVYPILLLCYVHATISMYVCTTLCSKQIVWTNRSTATPLDWTGLD